MSIIDDLELSVRTSNVLGKMGVQTLDDFMALTRTTVLAQKNAGDRTSREVAEVQQWLRGVQKQRRRQMSGGPAYPIPKTDTHDTWPGMTLRDAAALAALQGFCTQADASGIWSWPLDGAAADAWRVADAFIAARETGEK